MGSSGRELPLIIPLHPPALTAALYGWTGMAPVIYGWAGGWQPDGADDRLRMRRTDWYTNKS